ncbi:MAG: glutamine synthetase III [Clostridiales bacterium]
MSRIKVTELFGTNVFNEAVMKERLPKETYQGLKNTMEQGLSLDPSIAQIVANAMKDWALEKGVTHYTHWFQPMTGITAEKHDAFISPTADGRAIMEFSGKALVMGEPDASSFPSGGLRATFEARGYTAWDPTSYAFVKDGSLYIPTTFCSYTGEVLDKKTPLLRSMEALNKEALRVLKVLGNPAKRIVVNVGAEQEYFLVDRGFFKQRKDLVMTGRTLFGAMPPKGQELDDHYFGIIKDRVNDFMKDLDENMWSLGIYSKTKHNEAAPAQHEFAPIFTKANLAIDQNQLAMELMKKVSRNHNLACLLHEKPFDGVNGSGKHNNWSIGTDLGENLLDPGEHPAKNKRFLLFLCAIIEAVDNHAELLRLSVATAGNDHRLGGNEAPPAIISIFLGDYLTSALEAAINGDSMKDCKTQLETGVDSLPILSQDNTDRNRTSPLAFTGNKFEFRMPGSSQSISGLNFALNTMVAESLSKIADILENTQDDIETTIDQYITDTIKNHSRIIFNGNNYSDEWLEEAAKRGLPNLTNTPLARREFISEKNIALLTKHNILTKEEIYSRYEINMEGYVKTVNIEALTMLDMAKQEILPAVLNYTKGIFESLTLKNAVGLELDNKEEEKYAKTLSDLTEELFKKINNLEKISNAKPQGDIETQAFYYADNIIPAMADLRGIADKLETMVSKDAWPFPTYGDLLFDV